MPTLPTYNAQQNINANPVAPARNEATQPFKDQQQVISTLGDITQKWSNANDVMQYTKAKTNAQIAIMQQESAAKLDPNPDNAPAHIQAVQDVTTRSLDGISNQMVAQKAGEEIKADAFISSIKINSIFKQKQMLANDTLLQQSSDAAAQNYSNAVPGTQEAQHIQDKFMTDIQRNFASGLITEGRAKSLIDNYKIGIVKADLEREGATNLGQSQVLSELNKGNDGRYAGLSTDQRTESDRLVRLNIKENRELGVTKVFSNRVNTIKSIADGSLTWQNTEAIGQISISDPKLGEALQAVYDRNSKGKEYKPIETQNKDFAKVVNNLFSSKTKEEINPYLVDMLNQTISRDRMAILINAAEQRGATLPTAQGSNNGQDSPQQAQVDNAVKHIQNFVNENPNSENVFVHFFKNLFGGHNPPQAKDAAIQTYNLQQYPWVGNLPKEGAVYRDKITGAKRRIFPDGSFKEEK